MKFRIPLTFSDIESLKKNSKKFAKFFSYKKSSKLGEYLINSDANISRQEYLGICSKTFVFSFFILFVALSTASFFLKISFLYALLISFLLSVFILFRQLNYPKVYSFQKTRNIEKNLISALQDIMVQLESGVPIFQIISNISQSDYGYVSYEFGKGVREINSGISQIDAVENLIKRNSSVYFKRVLWQISNGMRSGSDMAIVIQDSINNLNKEQTIQIQSYGNKLNPLIMFYMLIAVILPSLGIAFMTIISSMLGLEGYMIKLLFAGVFAILVLIQIMFLGVVKSRRPSLL